jgi:hypothetical protein
MKQIIAYLMDTFIFCQSYYWVEIFSKCVWIRIYIDNW